MKSTTYFPENLADYNFTLATVIGLVILVLIVYIVIVSSRGKKSRNRPE